uniref:Uncharacterized protein n=1 Tax=Panagrolaimus sp. JU765 TaxID=591449 RepID=A0AC34R8X7_9BILA
MRVGDVYPNILGSEDKFQNAHLVTTCLWKFLEGKGTIWIQTSPSSDFVHVYVYSNEFGKYLCGNCSSNGRYSRAELIKLPNGENGMFEHQEHFSGYRLPLRLFAEPEKEKQLNNPQINGSRSSIYSLLNSEAFVNVHLPTSARNSRLFSQEEPILIKQLTSLLGTEI